MVASLRIALLTYSTKPRGSVIHTLELAEALHQLGHDVCIYALDKDGKGFDRRVSCAYHPVAAKSAPDNMDQLIHQRIQEFVDDLGNGHLHDRPYDIYHAQDCISANALAQLRQQGIIPHFIRTVHHIDDFNSPYLQECQEQSIHQPDLCLCVSDYWQQQLHQRYGIHAPRVLNGINIDRFSARSAGSEYSLKQQLGLVGYPIYLTVGGIEPRKNTIALLHAFTQVLVHYPQAQLVIAGGATLFDYQPYRDEFFAQVLHYHNIEIGKSLILLGVVSEQDLPALYRTADAFVFPSLKEGWGLVVLEAIASGLPVITSDQPPFTEFLSRQQALLVNPQSTSEIAAAMLKIAQPSIARSLTQQSQPLCIHYSWTTSAQLHLEQYDQLLESTNSKSLTLQPTHNS